MCSSFLGCWYDDDNEKCNLTHCISKKSTPISFCCCSQSLCNTNFTSLPLQAEEVYLKDNQTSPGN